MGALYLKFTVATPEYQPKGTKCARHCCWFTYVFGTKKAILAEYRLDVSN
jgi:hypothetical protein